MCDVVFNYGASTGHVPWQGIRRLTLIVACSHDPDQCFFFAYPGRAFFPYLLSMAEVAVRQVSCIDCKTVVLNELHLRQRIGTIAQGIWAMAPQFPRNGGKDDQSQSHMVAGRRKRT